MTFLNDLWQGSCDDWSTRFIDRNLLAIGYTAWDGYINFGRGLVVCKVNKPVNSWERWQIEMMGCELKFIPESQVINYLQKSQLDSKTILYFLEILTTYYPNDEIPFLLEGNGQIDLDLLQGLAISPSECHAQVLKHWSEFQLCFITNRRNE
ncbi:hypothetical protein [Floridanema evergladense]|uniref:Uncharacterized protein n=1 Tax=Floridaenema evergladense BLCC-F167 TaxID=3153639 RepID=A0ABV4WLM9_9CYAN